MLITPHLVRLSRLYVFFIRLFSFSSLPSIPRFPRFLVFFALWFHSCLLVVSSPAFPMRPVNIHSNWVKLALRRGSIMPGLLPFSFPDSTFFFLFFFWCCSRLFAQHLQSEIRHYFSFEILALILAFPFAVLISCPRFLF